MEEVKELLKELNIEYELVEHEAVYTCDECNELVKGISGIGCKNLFLRDNNKNFYIYFLRDTNRANFEYLQNLLGVEKIKLGREEELTKKTKLTRGMVTPLGIMNNTDRDLTLILDHTLVGERVQMHPCTNLATISMDFEDLIKIIKHFGNKYILDNKE